jgi:type II secretion system protein C
LGRITRFSRRWRWLAVVTGAGFGAFTAYQYWPHLQREIDEPQALQPLASSPVPETAPTVVPEPLIGVLGTDASISNKPLPLVLVGTLPGRNPREGAAMLGTDGRNAQTYLAGALLSNGARIAEIHERYIVLERDDRHARLYLQDRKSRASSKPNPEDLAMVGGVANAPALVPANQDPITNYIRPNALYAGDVLRGLEVYAGRQTGIFSQLGLRAGDVLISLDGVPLSDVTQAIETLRSLVTGARLNAILERDGKRHSVSLNGALIAADQERQRQIAVSAHSAEPSSPAL